MYVWRCIECGAEVYRATAISDDLRAVRERALLMQSHAKTAHPGLLGELGNGVSYHVRRIKSSGGDHEHSTT